MLIAALLFLSSTIWGSVAYIVFASIFCLRSFENKYYKTAVFKIILLIGFLSIINYVLTFSFNGGVFLNNNSSPVPYGVTLICSFIIACSLNKKNFKWLLCFILIDVGVALIEYICGVNSFWNIKSSTFEEGSDLLYFKRSCGLDPNSSILGINILIGLIILYIYPTKYNPLFLLFMSVGLFCSFNRSVIIASVPLFIYFIKGLIKVLPIYIKVLTIICIFGLFCYIFKSYFGIILEQFFRGASSFDTGALSHRDEIWKTFMGFFYDHPINGNGSIKMLLSNGWHSHNSFIWVLASNGIIIASLYFLYTFAYINKKNFIPIFSILLCSITQSVIYWGMSLPDILLLYLIINYNDWSIKQTNGKCNRSKITLTSSNNISTI